MFLSAEKICRLQNFRPNTFFNVNFSKLFVGRKTKKLAKDDSANRFFGRKIIQPKKMSGPKNFRPKYFSDEKVFGRKIIRPKKFFSAESFDRAYLQRKVFRSIGPKKFSAEKIIGPNTSRSKNFAKNYLRLVHLSQLISHSQVVVKSSAALIEERFVERPPAPEKARRRASGEASLSELFSMGHMV